MKAGFVTIYGKANAGKSSILNGLLKAKLEAVSERPQTTRENILGIYNDADSQICFIDTPGIFTPHAKLGANLLREAEAARRQAEVLLFVFAADEGIDKDVLANVQSVDVPVVVAYNKIDLVRADEGRNKLAKLQKALPKAKFVEMSCKEKFGFDDLVKALKDDLPEGEPMYPTDIISDRPKEFVYGELIREKCMRLLKQEVPHTIFVDVKSVEEEEEGIAIRADVIVERESEKAIVIGKRGSMISKISGYAEKAISSFAGKPVYVRLLVKVVPDWRNDPSFLNSHGLSGRSD